MPAVTRSVASASALRSGMLDPPQELQRLVAQSLLDIDFRAFLRLFQTCRALRSNFLPVLHARRAEDSARLNFAADSEGGRISAGGKTFTKRAASFSEIHQFMNDGCPLYAWATGHPLPLAGKFIWRVRLDVAHGSVWVGVCTADLKQAWALSMYNGELHRSVHKSGACPLTGEEQRTFIRDTRVPPPAGFPDGDGTSLIPRLQKNLTVEGHLLAHALTFGNCVDVLVDVTAGTLTFMLDDGGGEVEALAGFPSGVALRPFVCLLAAGDRVTWMTRI